MHRKETPFIGSQESRAPRQTSPTSPVVPGKLVASAQGTVSHSIHSSANFFQDINLVAKPKLEIVPMDLHHPILREFPEHREVIRRLKGSNEQFRKAFDEYHRLDDEIYRIEEDIDFATDQEIEELKMTRARLKDYIYHFIRHTPIVVPVCETTGTTAQIAAH